MTNCCFDIPEVTTINLSYTCAAHRIHRAEETYLHPPYLLVESRRTGPNYDRALLNLLTGRSEHVSVPKLFERLFVGLAAFATPCAACSTPRSPRFFSLRVSGLFLLYLLCSFLIYRTQARNAQATRPSHTYPHQ